ncbi:MAG: helix-turn-helix transcriptional regulator [Erysipelotrichaceae bacterium]
MLTREELLIRVGDLIKSKRILLGLTRAQAAKRSNLNEVYYRDVERGNRNLSLLSLEKIAKGLNLSVRDLLDANYNEEE